MIGYVVLSRRPNPYTETGWDYELVKMNGRDDAIVFQGPDGAAQAENARDYCDTAKYRERNNIAGDVEFVVGEVGPEWSKR